MGIGYEDRKKTKLYERCEHKRFIDEKRMDEGECERWTLKLTWSDT